MHIAVKYLKQGGTTVIQTFHHWWGNNWPDRIVSPWRNSCIYAWIPMDGWCFCLECVVWFCKSRYRSLLLNNLIKRGAEISKHTPRIKFSIAQRHRDNRYAFSLRLWSLWSLTIFGGLLRIWMSSFALWSWRWDMFASAILLNLQKVLLCMAPYL